ncbi:hypothetical protein [Flavobacterium hercynium]|jgi:hypothetical protein|uniref:Uncharacterized protein n=1 Tax=Flavobacterium hercynium TaxID=387094 RepID=A0A226HN35_9FLAO|nr:hypothetical protein [Flavobacterium hercynium]OXA95595.1 hypothetical protein B0A66_02725 [Flavobacterium hercynium]PAM94042.1 hypothetical protein B4N84_13225 [Flavobacterium sp. IR1]SMP22494.1 hypothetical protein SAMN06265346_107169 [Flavobacterium hercynium]
MELNKIEDILEKYFQGETTIAEENELKNYFSSPNVAQHLEQYKPIFGYFSQVKQQKSTQEIKTPVQESETIPLQTKKRNVAWLSIAASVVVLLGIGTYLFVSEKDAAPAVAQTELGTYDDPEEALAATQKALAMVSNNVNVGLESVHYIKEYEHSKKKIFKL